MTDVSVCLFCKAPVIAGMPYCLECGRAFVTAKNQGSKSNAGGQSQHISGVSAQQEVLPQDRRSTVSATETRTAREMLKSIPEIHLDRDTDLLFSSNSREFWKLRRNFEASVIGKSRFEEEVEKLKLRDKTGDWWAIDSESGNWRRFDGKAWVASTPPKIKPAPVKESPGIPEQEEAHEQKRAEPKAAALKVPATAAEPIVCPSCRKPVRVGNRFCQSCGSQLKRDEDKKVEKVSEAPQTLLCSRCGVPLRPGLKFCTHCGDSVART
jgi:hypothetical protein